MTNKELIVKLTERCENDPYVIPDAIQLLRPTLDEDAVFVDGKPSFDSESYRIAMDAAVKLRKLCANWTKLGGGKRALDSYKQTLLFQAPYDFDCYCRYLEWNRDYRKRFYEPRRKQLKPIADALQQLGDGEIDLLAISMPPGTGKTTIAIFFLTWIAGRNPELSILGGSHSNSFLNGVYGEILRIVGNDSEYLFRDVFPTAVLAGTNAKDMRIDLEIRKRFETFEFSSIGSGNAGKVRCSNMLYCDDLVDGIETAMSMDRLNKLWQQYYTDLRQRKIGSCRELHIATRWSIYDVIGRLEQQYGQDERAKFIAFPAMDENDESNFDYPYNLGFTTQFYREQRDIMDDASWRALYMNEPIEREGVLYHPTELRRYFDLPESEPDTIIAVCDTKEQGLDYYAMPVAYRYGNDFYIDTFICDNGKPEVVEERIVNLLVTRKVKSCRIESNRGGTRIAESIQKKVRERGGFTNITTKWNETNKETRIIVSSAFIKQYCLFKDESLYANDKEYRQAMSFLTGYTMGGKNKHDDIPDAMSMLSDFIQSYESGHVEVVKRPF